MLIRVIRALPSSRGKWEDGLSKPLQPGHAALMNVMAPAGFFFQERNSFGDPAMRIVAVPNLRMPSHLIERNDETTLRSSPFRVFGCSCVRSYEGIAQRSEMNAWTGDHMVRLKQAFCAT
jgi:hypothetical protein